MKKTSLYLFAFMFYSMSVFADKCNNILSGYENSDVIYVICEDLSGLSQEDASGLIKEIFDQYKGPPDEIVVYFVKSQNLIGKIESSSEGLVAHYYTHNNQLTLWPEDKDKTRVLKIKW